MTLLNSTKVIWTAKDMAQAMLREPVTLETVEEQDNGVVQFLFVTESERAALVTVTVETTCIELHKKTEKN